MTRRWMLSAMAIAFAMLLAFPALAQNSSYYNGTTTNGLFGQNTVGGSSSSTTGRSLGSTSGTSGSTGTSGATSGTGQQNVALTARNSAPAVQLTQTRGAFVGADSSDTTNLRSLQGAQGASRAGGMNDLSQLRDLFSGNQGNFNGQNQGATTRPQVRLTLKLGFKTQPVSAMRVRAFETQLTKLPGIQWAGPAQVVMEGRTAVLRGKVATEEDRELAEALAKMEPDVLAVRNELVVVDSPESAAEELPPAVTPSSP